MPRNKIFDFDLSWIDSIEVKNADITSKVATSKFSDKAAIAENCTPSWIMKAISCVDLALLVGTETPESVGKLCNTAVFPLEAAQEGDKSKIAKLLEHNQVHCAAVCIYPLRIEDAVGALSSLGGNSVLVAAVAAGFPSGQYPLETRLGEIQYAVREGAQEIDVVIDRSLVLRGLWQRLYDELVQMRNACGDTTLKVILSVTECGSWTNVYKASAVAMLAGADFIKTSTGKEATAVTIHEGYVMCLAIKDFHARTGQKVGLKPAGGVRTVEHAVSWMLMLQEMLDEEWVNPRLFRIGTSSVVASLAAALLKA